MPRQNAAAVSANDVIRLVTTVPHLDVVLSAVAVVVVNLNSEQTLFAGLKSVTGYFGQVEEMVFQYLD